MNNSKKVLVDLNDFPKFLIEHIGDTSTTWEENLLDSGYPSAILVDDTQRDFLMDEIEYTHFVLRWT